MWQRTFPKSDVEAGARPLYPMMLENPQLRWAFIRKIYSIVAVQLLLTIAVAAVVVTVHPIAYFFVSTGAGLALYIVLIFVPFIVLCPLYYYHQRHPVNYLLLGVFTVSLAFVVGLTCAFTSGLESGTTHKPSPTLYHLSQASKATHEGKVGKVILESVILTTVVVVSLTLYTFWAAKRGYDFNFLGPFLFGAILVLMVFALIQILFPLGRLSVMIYGLLASLIFCGYIIYDTDNLIKRYSYDEYIWAAVSLYLDVINLFLALLTVFRAADT
ncbi:Protein LIFEGUARD 4 [Vitis vinifera]|uniref:Protein LIFEGUARD 4 n=1 Tax=Vitis vinifera TaxID=29760 RepID=A0A438KI83_VITVI|nr:Protein LIFEGUARD 4 [Vitis vinifera]RVX20906.1 Protein LIFEGUARD 4 [Vitis vinifera]